MLGCAITYTTVIQLANVILGFASVKWHAEVRGCCMAGWRDGSVALHSNGFRVYNVIINIQLRVHVLIQTNRPNARQ